MEIITISIILVIALALIFIGFFKKQSIVLLFAGILFLFLGVGMFPGISDSVTFIVNNSTGTTLENITTTTNNDFTTGLAIITSMIGLALIFIPIFDLLKKGQVNNLEDENNED